MKLKIPHNTGLLYNVESTQVVRLELIKALA